MAFVSAALHIATLVFLFFAHVRFRASDSLTGVLRKRCGRDVVNEVRNLEKKDLKHKKDNFGFRLFDILWTKLCLPEIFTVQSF